MSKQNYRKTNESLYTEGLGRWDFLRFNLQNREEHM